MTTEDKVLQPATGHAEKAWELVKGIKHLVKQHSPSYRVLLDRLKLGGKYYNAIMSIVETQYAIERVR